MGRLFLKALVVMVLKRLPNVRALLAGLEQPTPEMRQLRALLTEGSRFPVRRTVRRRLAAAPFAEHGRAVALDSSPLHACGGVWHQ